MLDRKKDSITLMMTEQNHNIRQLTYSLNIEKEKSELAQSNAIMAIK
jgi:hypothetical protein